MHYAYYTPWKIWKTFNGVDKKKVLTVWFGVVGAFGGGLPLLLFCFANGFLGLAAMVVVGQKGLVCYF